MQISGSIFKSRALLEYLIHFTVALSAAPQFSLCLKQAALASIS